MRVVFVTLFADWFYIPFNTGTVQRTQKPPYSPFRNRVQDSAFYKVLKQKNLS
jgi:hypothetical protein